MKLMFYYTSERVYHDDNGNLYTSGNFTPEVWERYTTIAEEVHVVMTDSGETLSEEDARKTKQIVNNSKIFMHLIPDRFASLRSFMSKEIRQKINVIQKEVFTISDFAVIRPANSSAIARYRKTGKPYAIEVVGCAWDAFWNHSLKGKVLAPYEFLYAKNEVRKTAFALYVTNKYLQKRYPTNGFTTNCSNVSLNPPETSILEERLKRIEGYSKDTKIHIGTAAALNVRYKGQEYVIRALGKLKQQGITNFEYQVIGGGSADYLLRVARECDVEDKLKVVGQLSHDKVFSWLRNIDIYIQPSLQEGLPRSVIEAMSYGLPCAGSRVAGIPELLTEDMLFKGKDVNGIVRILRSLSPARMSELAEMNFEAAKQYDVEILKKRRHDFYMAFRNYAEKQKK